MIKLNPNNFEAYFNRGISKENIIKNKFNKNKILEKEAFNDLLYAFNSTDKKLKYILYSKIIERVKKKYKISKKIYKHLKLKY